ncbi:MFS transporter [Sinimarinibacterium flocculans]|uniref:MFS transporter n=1 Tax=Sinimarinibacterium flocculans TaxID=985250 RepID=UPI002490EF28|nr:MFS transporter [Sinimarinibacterium flocculans]
MGNLAAGNVALFFGLSSFMEPLQTEFGWSRTAIGLALTCLTLAVSLAAPVVGRLVDRHGGRRVALWSLPSAALGIAGLSLLGGSLVVFYVAYVFVALLGAGTLGLVYVPGISATFDRHRGLALGIAFAGAGLAAFLFPLLLTPVIAEWGWRAGWLVLAALPLLQWVLVATQMPAFRMTPTASLAPRTPGMGVPAAQALRSRRFRLLCGVFFLLALTLSGLVVNLVVLLRDHGLGASAAAGVASMVGVGIIVARIGAGWLCDRWFAPRVALGICAAAAVGCLCLMLADLRAVSAGALLIGLSVGAEMDLLALLVSRYFGLLAQAEIFGMTYAAFNAGAMVSPLFIGGLQAMTGSYVPALLASAVACVLAGALVSRLGPYPRFSPSQ